MSLKLKLRFAAFVYAFILCAASGFSVNPNLSKYLINLSEGSDGPEFNDKVPEIAISGNTIHVVWTQNPPSYTRTSELYYRRSTDLGETWEAPKKIMVFKDGNYGIQEESRRLAVDGDVVHICTADYNYAAGGIGEVHYFRSQNGGASFENDRIIANTSGGYKAIDNCFIKAEDGKVAVAYQGNGDKKGSWVMYSGNGGSSFSDTQISNESTYVGDFYYDGEKIIVLYGYAYYMYGLNTGKIWLATSENGTNFNSSKISTTYTTQYGERERCQVAHGDHYSSKIARSGNNIHVIFTGYTEGDVWTTFYTRSSNGGNSFESARNIGALASEGLQNGSETVAAKNGNVYWLAASTYPTNNNSGNRFHFSYSHDNGTSFSEPRSIMNPDVYHVGKASLPAIVIDPLDESGNTLYLTGNWLFSTKSVDGGVSFSGSTTLAPSLKSNIINMSHAYMKSFMQIDAAGGKHWITQAQWRSGTDQDIFYRNVKPQPGPGTINKAFYVENPEKSYETDLVVVPSSKSIQFDSAMTAELWVRFDPKTIANFSIMAKVDGYDGYDTNPEGYQLAFRQNNARIDVSAGIKTDKDAPVNWGEIDLNDSLWHHIAFTYDANAGLNNFRLYINGMLHQQTTLTGVMTQEDGMLMLGARNLGNGWYYDAMYSMDELRLWDRALSQEELLENQTKKFTGQEEGLKLYFNFDDTFKDLSGNGNDGIPVYNGTLRTSDFDPPLPEFESFKQGNQLSVNNKSKNATSSTWYFGDGTTSSQGNPSHVYAKPGEYTISLFAANTNSVTGAVQHVTIEGLDKVEPASAGNYGYATLVVYGGGLVPEGHTVLLRKGELEIQGAKLYAPAPGQLAGIFYMTGAELGTYDVVVQYGGSELLLEKAFKVLEAKMPEPWVSLSGRGMALFNMWQSYTISYGNKGNIDALGVPLNIVISDLPDLEVEFIDFRVEANEYMKTNTPEIVEHMDTLYDVVENYFGPGLNARFYPLFIPLLEANSTHSIRIRIKSPDDFNIESWTNDPFFEAVDSGTKSASSGLDDWPDDKTRLNACIALSAANAASSVAMDALGMLLPVDCLYDFSTLVFNPWNAAKPEMNEPSVFDNWGYSLASAAISCVGDLSPIKAIKIGIKITSIVNNMYQGYMAHQDCLNNFDPRYKSKKGVKAVSSFDPNEMVGPSGFGEQNFIVKYDRMPYTILFENKKEATAPAHIVTITDTLDLAVFDLNNFGFASFGWGDTLFSPPGEQLTEFSMDLDLRPGMELITRVSGKLDTLTGVIIWEFLSLNPQTMELEEDPFVGFLPPNANPPEGDGFVSFTVGLREELGTNAELRNKASIVFDANKPIVTNEFLNTLDLDPPSSSVVSLESTNFNNFMVEWTGSDVGAGIQHYDVFVLENDTLLYNWLRNNTDESAEFQGSIGSSYKFYSMATDQVGHLENEKDQYEAQTTIIVGVDEMSLNKKTIEIYPNPASDNINIRINDEYRGVHVIEIVGINGTIHHSEIYRNTEIQQGISIDLKTYQPGSYLLRVVSEGKSETIKILIK
ncbi:LamG-like jellyroll fold domain-containing protein [Roseimarinus sediminis]|uniref:LamG-like jellyroll fold domain-containing protein n=1 Tax=Roseimarinus sediminis TaxID=1610899 RepID=UPI003D195A55